MSISFFQHVFPPRFKDEVLGKELYIARAFAGDQLAQLYKQIDWLVCRGTLPYPAGRLVRDGAEVPTELYVGTRQIGPVLMEGLLIPEAVIKQISQGASLVLTHGQRLLPKLDDAARSIGEDLSRSVRANIYLTPPHSRALDLHTDCHDVLVYQLRGSKRWVIYPPRRSPQEAEAQDYQLNEGDILYMPKNTYHKAISEQGSLHVTFGLVEPEQASAPQTSLRVKTSNLPMVSDRNNSTLPMEHGALLACLSTSEQRKVPVVDYVI